MVGKNGEKWSKMDEKGVKTMTGEYQHALDTKGRIFIPAKLRDELGQIFYVTLSMDRCLSVYSAENWEKLVAKVNEMPYIRQRKMRPLFAYAIRCELDAQGRALLPQNLRDWAGLEKNVAVIGCNNHLELWDSESWSAVLAQETTPENIAAVMEELEF